MVRASGRGGTATPVKQSFDFPSLVFQSKMGEIILSSFLREGLVFVYLAFDRLAGDLQRGGKDQTINRGRLSEDG